MSKDFYHGMYRGVVVNNTDDPLDSGRVTIRVFSIYDGVEDEHLPWAQFADPFMGGGSDSGGFWIPDVGDHVWVFFEAGDYMLPVYFAGAPARPHMPAEKANGYPKNRIFKSKAGHLVEISDEAGNERIHVKHSTGTETEIDKDGNVSQIVVSNVTQEVTGNVTQTVGGNVIQTISGDFTQNVTGNVSQSVDGNVNSTVQGNMTASVTGTSNVTGTGTVNVTAPAGITFDTPTATFTGAVAIGGAATIGGATTMSAGMTVSGGGGNVTGGLSIDSVDFGSHVHDYTDDGASMTTGGPANP